MVPASPSINTDDAPALAEAIVHHATKLCETTDHLWRVIGEVAIPTTGFTDRRQQHKVERVIESFEVQ
jgi:hypothetical protein